MNIFLETATKSDRYTTKPFHISESLTLIHDIDASGTIWTPKETTPQEGLPRIIVTPGFLGTEKDELVVRLASHLANNGFEVVTFNYDNDDWDSIAGNLLVVQTVLHHMTNKPGAEPVNPKNKIRAGLIGVSYGGTLALLSPSDKTDLRAIISLGPLVNPYKVLTLPYFKDKIAKSMSGRWLIGKRRHALPAGFIHAFHGFETNLSAVQLLDTQDSRIAEIRYKPPNDDIFLDTYGALNQPVVLIHADETEADVISQEESRKIFNRVRHGSLHVLDRPPNMQGRDVHNFQGELRQPLFDLVLRYA
ncbi:MAG: hypothetical protein AAB874_00765 [Patescibacteria group bacterium]